MNLDGEKLYEYEIDAVTKTFIDIGNAMNIKIYLIIIIGF